MGTLTKHSRNPLTVRSMNEQRTRVLLVDDHCMFLEALRLALQSVGQFDVVGVATNTDEGLLLANEREPDVVICDIQLPGAGGFCLAEALHAQRPETRFAILTGFCSDALLESALRVHVCGYLLKTDPIDELVAAILAIARGEMHFSSSIRHRLMSDADGKWRVHSATLLSSLSTQQVEVLRHLARGLSVKEVARLMNVTAKAIDSQKYRLMKLLGIHDRVVLAHFAVEHGLISPDQEQRLAS